VFPSLLEAPIEALLRVDIPYPATIGLALGVAVLVRQYLQPGAANAPA
jgi:hypothetical protein